MQCEWTVFSKQHLKTQASERDCIYIFKMYIQPWWLISRFKGTCAYNSFSSVSDRLYQHWTYVKFNTFNINNKCHSISLKTDVLRSIGISTEQPLYPRLINNRLTQWRRGEWLINCLASVWYMSGFHAMRVTSLSLQMHQQNTMYMRYLTLDLKCSIWLVYENNLPFYIKSFWFNNFILNTSIQKLGMNARITKFNIKKVVLCFVL